MTATEILFWVLSALALFSALMVLISKNPVHSVLWLIVVFFCYIRALYFIECTVSRYCKPDCLCRRYYGVVFICDYAYEPKQQYRAAEEYADKTCRFVAGCLLLLYLFRQYVQQKKLKTARH